jgi:pimeloyl-ACP methyl ester carboxylesterase
MSNQPPVVILIHGYNVSDLRQSVGKFRPYFEAEGCLVETYAYGYWPFPWQITKRNPKFAREVAARVSYWKNKGRAVILVLHSNGGTIARLACLVHGARADRILAIHPALHSEMEISHIAGKVIVVHNKGDVAVVAGKVLGFFSRWIFPKSWVFRPWGDMGQDGYKGLSETHFNIDSGDESHPIRCHGHSQEFEEGYEAYWLPLLVNKILA